MILPVKSVEGRTEGGKISDIIWGSDSVDFKKCIFFHVALLFSLFIYLLSDSSKLREYDFWPKFGG